MRYMNFNGRTWSNSGRIDQRRRSVIYRRANQNLPTSLHIQACSQSLNLQSDHPNTKERGPRTHDKLPRNQLNVYGHSADSCFSVLETKLTSRVYRGQLSDPLVVTTGILPGVVLAPSFLSSSSTTPPRERPRTMGLPPTKRKRRRLNAH
jgi:hypothetical protein